MEVGDLRARLRRELTQEPRQGRTARSPAVATFLSFLWPGLGQLYSGAQRSALLFGLPLLVVFFVVGLQALGGPENLLIELLTPSTALTVLILIVLLGAWRLISMGDALSSPGRSGAWRRPVPIASFLVLALIVVTTHAAAASLAWSFYDAGKQIFAGVPDPDVAPAARVGAVLSVRASGLPGTTPAASETPEQARINILLTGIDSSESRTHALNDTLLVLSLDPSTGELAMVSFPRDMARLPTPDGKMFPAKINSLMSYADRHIDQYPEGGMAALTNEIGYLLGARVDYYASVDLDGFSKLIDRVGGVTVDVTEAIDDPAYSGWKQPGRIGFRLSTGSHDLNGEEALAYVRSRKTFGDSDLGRARRQQQLLVALQRKLIDPAMLPMLPGILKDATQTLKTNFPPDRLSEMLDLARKTDEASIKRYVLGPPYTVHPTNVTSTYMLVPDMAWIAKLSIALFGAGSRYSTDPG
jgi:LCP family protein required for cell wall assembly